MVTPSRRLAVAAGLVVLAGLAASGCSSDRGSADPAHPAGRSTASPSAVPSGPVWMSESGVHADGRLVAPPPLPDGPWAAPAHAPAGLALLRAGVAYRMPDGTVYVQPFAGARREVATGTVAGPGADVDGTVVAWLESRAGRAHVVVLDTATDRVLARAGVHPGRKEDFLYADQPFVEVADDRLLLRLGWDEPRVWDWHFREEQEPILLPSGPAVLDRVGAVTAQAGPRLVDRRTGAWSLTRVRLCRGTDCLTARTPPVFAEGAISPDGRWFAASTGYERGHRLVLVGVGSGQEHRLPVGRPVVMPHAMPYTWAGDDTLMFGTYVPDRGPDAREYLACDVSENRCRLLTRHRDRAPDGWTLLPS